MCILRLSVAVDVEEKNKGSFKEEKYTIKFKWKLVNQRK